MRIKKLRNLYLIRLLKGEEIISALRDAVREKGVKGGMLFGLGAGKDFTIGYYDLTRRHYIKKFIAEECEILSLSGNVAFVEKEEFIHAHIILSQPNFFLTGGHLFSGFVTATCEIFLYPSPIRIGRRKSEEIGLNLLDI